MRFSLLAALLLAFVALLQLTSATPVIDRALSEVADEFNAEELALINSAHGVNSTDFDQDDLTLDDLEEDAEWDEDDAASTGAVEERSTLEKRHSGRGTYFKPGMGACGWWSGSSDMITAISQKRWGGGKYCGRMLRVCHSGKCTRVKIVDMCPGCGKGSLDLSPRAFKKLAPLSQGVIGVSWSFN